MGKKSVNPHAKALSDLGASKGGKARSNTLSAAERKEIARQAARARWGKNSDPEPDDDSLTEPDEIAEEERSPSVAASDALYSLMPGTIRLGDLELECHVLSDHRRVFTQREIVKVISGGRESGNLRRYLDRNPLIDNELILGPEIRFLIGRTPAIGREATALVEICEKYLEADEQDLLHRSQARLVKQAQIVMRACAKIGIIALVDEATGFQRYREKRALQLKLQAFIAEDMQEWARMFPDEFWFELARLEGVRYSPRSRPLRWGKYIMTFVYDAIDKDIGDELRKRNPNPHYRQNHHQWLKQFGRERVTEQITKVVTIMKLCGDMQDFRKKFARVFEKSAYQMDFWDEL